MNSITAETLSFNQENIRPGHLAILYDDRDVIIGSGIVVVVGPLELKLALYMTGGHNHTIYEYEGDLQELTPYLIDIGHIASGEIKLFLINPDLYEIGKENAPVNY